MSHGEQTFCPECGPTTVPHFLYKYTQVIGIGADMVTRPVQPLARTVSGYFYRQLKFISFGILTALAALKLIRLAHEPLPEKDTDRARCMWKAARERGIAVSEILVFGRPIDTFLARLPDGSRMLFEGLPRPGIDSKALYWMDNKGTMKRKFAVAGFPVPRGKACVTKRAALAAFKEIRTAGSLAVVKPTWGSRSRHTRIHVGTEAELLEAFRIAKEICPVISVEEELRGSVYRAVLIGGKIAGVLRRDPPLVIGDGKENILGLIAVANIDSRRHTSAFHEIPVNAELDAALKAERMTRNSVPEKGRVVTVGTKIGRSQGGTNTDVTDHIHPDNRKLFTDIAAYLQDPLVGIDFMIGDIGKSWREQLPCGTIELNSLPFLDLHAFPFEGEPRDLSAFLWDEVLRG